MGSKKERPLRWRNKGGERYQRAHTASSATASKVSGYLRQVADEALDLRDLMLISENTPVSQRSLIREYCEPVVGVETGLLVAALVSHYGKA